ncbi:hypothetical protein TRIUR3_18038 [Triticum urartu]|uniref:Uncharacterized protein n=1 Tax=Triticum urartu TaxID=4572 RepID=M7Z706_TRIUA|nr:hypothetical protein TRIUR3_18038 [Triticum urartu]
MDISWGVAITQKIHQKGKDVIFYNVYRDNASPVAKAIILSIDRRKLLEVDKPMAKAGTTSKLRRWKISVSLQKLMEIRKILKLLKIWKTDD